MKPSSHKGVGAIGVPVRHRSASVRPNVLAQEAVRYSRQLSQTSADSVLALVAFAANQALTRQIEAAHQLGQLTLAQSKELDATAKRALPAGPCRDALMLAARMQANAADTLVSVANQWGRRFGRLAFAFPMPDRVD